MKEENPYEILLEELCRNQEIHLVQYALECGVLCTAEDLLQPMDFPVLESHPLFRYQEGILMGLRMALAAVRRDLLCGAPSLEAPRNTIG